MPMRREGNRHFSRRIVPKALAMSGALAAGVAISACSGGSNSSAPRPTQPPAHRTAKSTDALVRSRALAVAATRPKSLAVPKVTLGLVNVLYASPAAQRIQQGAVQAAKDLGWKVLTTDANGNPTAMEAGIIGYVNQHVNAIIDLSNSTEAIAQGLAAAKAAHIPVINIGGLQDPSPLLAAQYTNNDAQMSFALVHYMVKHIKKGTTVAVDEFPLLASERIRDGILINGLKAAGIKVVTHQSNFANLVADTQTATATQIAANPNLSAIVGDTDAEMPVIAQVLKNAGKCSTIGNYNFYDDPQNTAAIRQGCGTAVVTEPPGVDGFMAIDQLAQVFARHLPQTSIVKTTAALEAQWKIRLEDGPNTIIVDKANVPPAGQYAPAVYNYGLFFTTLWHSEFKGVKIHRS